MIRSRGRAARLLALALFLAPPLPARAAEAAARTATGRKAMVATASPLATEVALDVLKRGGNAVDAAVAAAFAVGVVEPDASGLGGGGGMLIRKANGEAVYVNYYGAAPAGVAGMKYDPAADAKSAKAILVPGAVAGLARALKEHGTFPLAAAVAPSIRLAEEGFAVDATLSGILLENFPVVAENEASAEVYLRDGLPLQEGEVLRQPRLAETLRAVARGGPRAFYEGPVAQAIVDGVRAAGGVLALEDLRRYEPTVTKPVATTYRGFEVLSAPPPHSGATVLEALNVLENADLAKSGPPAASADTFHLVAEAMRRAYADRAAFLADPRFEEVPVAALLSKPYARARFATIDPARVVPEDYRKTPAGDPSAFSPADAARESSVVGHTTQISVVDRHGNAVSITQTLGTFFGSGVTAAGVLLNCGVSNFAFSSRRNRLEPGKQPRSSISPTIVARDGRVVLVLGSPGAIRIVATVLTLLVNLLDFGMTADEANQAPRFLCQKNDSVLPLEGRFPPALRDELTRRGHRLQLYGDFDLFFGGAQVIRVDRARKLVEGSADPRRGGTAAGY
jgi:gamma-glutamyltranspeptidase/glutathione hydrolase